MIVSFRYDVTLMIPLITEAINAEAFHCEFRYDVSIMYVMII